MSDAVLEALIDPMQREREEWRGKAEHRLREWRLRDDDAKAAEAELEQVISG